MYCTKCDGEIPRGAMFCTYCGQPVQGQKMQPFPMEKQPYSGYMEKKPKIKVLVIALVLVIMALAAIVVISAVAFSGCLESSGSKTSGKKISAEMKSYNISMSKTQIDTLYMACQTVLDEPEFKDNGERWTMNYGVEDGVINIYDAADFDGPQSFLEKIEEYLGSDTIQIPADEYEGATVHIEIAKEGKSSNRVKIWVYGKNEDYNFSINA